MDGFLAVGCPFLPGRLPGAFKIMNRFINVDVALKCVDDEPELEGTISAILLIRIQESPAGVEEVLRAVVKATKKNIRERMLLEFM
jgi:hypothetical protein